MLEVAGGSHPSFIEPQGACLLRTVVALDVQRACRAVAFVLRCATSCTPPGAFHKLTSNSFCRNPTVYANVRAKSLPLLGTLRQLPHPIGCTAATGLPSSPALIPSPPHSSCTVMGSLQ